MKTFLLTCMALIAMQFTVRSTVAAEDLMTEMTEESLAQLVPADELATQDGLDLVDELSRRPPPPPHYPPQYPPPPPHYPPPPPHYPPPPPPTYYYYECAAQSYYGQTFVQRGTNPSYLQRNIVDICQYQTGTYCRALGCRRY